MDLHPETPVPGPDKVNNDMGIVEHVPCILFELFIFNNLKVRHKS